MTYTTVFDAGEAGFGIFWFPAVGLIFVVIGAVGLWGPRVGVTIPYCGPARYRTGVSWFFFLFAVLWTLLAFSQVLGSWNTARVALRDGDYRVVEGPVTNFVPMPYEGHGLESFTVGGKRFAYSDYIITPGFRNTASHGGPIREGLQVRVTYRGDLILRLEVAR